MFYVMAMTGVIRNKNIYKSRNCNFCGVIFINVSSDFKLLVIYPSPWQVQYIQRLIILSMKQFLLIVMVVLGLAGVRTLSDENIVIGVYTQKYFYGDHLATTIGKTLTYAGPPYANLGWMAGAKVVPIFSYLSTAQVLRQLPKINGLIFTGGQEHININNTWTANAHAIMQYAKKQNDQGRTFPILGICQGLQLMLYLTSDMRVDFLDSIQDQNGVFNTIQLVQKQKYYLIDGVSDKALAAITDPKVTKQGGPLYFFHSNGTLLSTFQRDTDLNQFWNLIGTTSKGTQTFVTYLQAKKYPFYVTQFHPQRLTYNSQLSQQFFETRIQLVNMIALNFAKQCRKSPSRYLSYELTDAIIDNYPMYTSTRFKDYKVYLFEENGPLETPTAHPQGLSGAGDIIGFILVVGLILGTVYYLYSRRKQQDLMANQRSVGIQIQRQQFVD